MKYYLIAGEASGDLHASHLMAALRQREPEAEFRCVGGDLMQAQGGTLVHHYRDLAYMGIWPVIRHLPTILRGMRDTKRDLLRWQPQVVILVDYPGFNLSVAKYVRKHLPGTAIFYYIPPKIWAWKEWRIRSLRRHTDYLFSILPFEVEYYHRRHHFHQVAYVGNPTLDEVRAYEACHPADFAHFIEENELDNRPIIALLAGSRQQEIRDNLSRMIEAARPFADRYQLVVAGAPGIDPSFYAQWTKDLSVSILYEKTYPLLQHSTAALVTSGTATLEAALFRVPQVVCYYIGCGKFVSFMRRLVLKIPYISLVNLVGGYEVVPELVADGMTAENVSRHLSTILPNGSRRDAMLQGYEYVIQRLGQPGAPQHTAEFIAP